MQLVQDIASSTTGPLKQGIIVTEPSTFKQVSALDTGLSRISERQQQLLLLFVGYACMGLMVALLTLMTLPKQPSGEAAKAVPAQVNKPAAYSPVSNQPIVNAEKTSARSLAGRF